MRSATLLAFVDWRPSAVKRVILSGVGWLCHWRGGWPARRFERKRRRSCLSLMYRRASAGSLAGSEAGALSHVQRRRAA